MVALIGSHEQRRNILAAVLSLALACGRASDGATAVGAAAKARPKTARTVFMILMENKDWSHILRSEKSARYIHQLLAGEAAYCRNYRNELGKGRHPSEPNYIILEAGGTYGLDTDGVPGKLHCARGVPHLASLLSKKGLGWKSYQEGISGLGCPLRSGIRYAPRHNPVLYFDDISGADCSDHASPVCESHVRPFHELAADLLHDRVGHYNFITPDLCNDMHDDCDGDPIRRGDDWLRDVVPMIQASASYQRGGVIFITWDEGGPGDAPIGLIALSPDARRGELDCDGRTHESLLRTVQMLLGVEPYLGGAASAPDISGLFNALP
ncbi:MAG: phosphoesterase [Myxococcaceae bacterium]|nr:phosphoesterase [Myxococcaceae bacterium]